VRLISLSLAGIGLLLACFWLARARKRRKAARLLDHARLASDVARFQSERASRSPQPFFYRRS